MAMVALGTAVVAALTLAPRPYGDAAEYLLMTESWAAHASPELRPADVEALRGHAARSGLAVHPEHAIGNYFEGRDGRFYCYHFWLYPLLTMPARLALRAAGADVLRAGPLTNALLFGTAIGAVLLFAPGPPLARRAAAALLASSPALGFLLWPHPEVLSFSMATLALVAGARGMGALAVGCAAVASAQNPPLVLLALFEAVRGRGGTTGTPRARKLAALILAALPALAAPAFYLLEFSTPNLAAYETAGVHALGLGKALGLMFDLELGLVRYAPLTVALLVALVPLLVRSPARGVEGAMIAVLALMMLACSATGNWNHGTTGPSRYVVWLFPVIAYLVALGPTASRLLGPPRRGHAALLAAAVVAQVGVAARRGGPLSPLDYLQHSTAARAILDRWPQRYDPEPEVFRERTAHTEADLDGPFIYEGNGRCRKALARWKHADALRDRCGAIPEPTRAFFESRPPKDEKSRWLYVSY